MYSQGTQLQYKVHTVVAVSAGGERHQIDTAALLGTMPASYRPRVLRRHFGLAGDARDDLRTRQGKRWLRERLVEITEDSDITSCEIQLLRVHVSIEADGSEPRRELLARHVIELSDSVPGRSS